MENKLKHVKSAISVPVFIQYTPSKEFVFDAHSSKEAFYRGANKTTRLSIWKNGKRAAYNAT